MIRLFGRRKKRLCGRCGGEMVRKTCRREIDPRREKVSVGGTRMVAGSAVEFIRVWYCNTCGQEDS